MFSVVIIIKCRPSVPMHCLVVCLIYQWIGTTIHCSFMRGLWGADKSILSAAMYWSSYTMDMLDTFFYILGVQLKCSSSFFTHHFVIALSSETRYLLTAIPLLY